MQKQTISNIVPNQELLERINRIVLLKIKTLIVKSLKERDIPEFEEIVKSGNAGLLLSFAAKKIPDFSKLFYRELEDLKKEIYLPE